MEKRCVTVLRRNPDLPDGVEIMKIAGFSIRTLLEIQETFCSLMNVIRETQELDQYRALNQELDTVLRKLKRLSLENRYKDGSMNPLFQDWSEEEKAEMNISLDQAP